MHIGHAASLDFAPTEGANRRLKACRETNATSWAPEWKTA